MLNNLGIGFAFEGKDMVSGVMGKVRRQFGLTEKSGDRMSKTLGMGFTAMAVGALTLGGGAAILGGSFNLAKEAGVFAKSVAATGSIAQATAGELAQLEEAAILAGLATKFEPTEAIEGLKDLASLGFSASESISALRPSLDLAAGGQLSVSDAASTTASALRVFSLEAADAGNVADKLMAISNTTALKTSDLGLAIGNVGRGAILTKQSIDEMLPAIGLISNTGLDASVAASSVSSSLLAMAKNAKKFSAIGVSVVDPLTGAFRPFLDVVAETQVALDKKFPNAAQNAAKATELFTRFGVSAYSAISGQLTKGIKDSTGQILKNADAVEFLRNAQVNATGTLERFVQAQAATFEEQLAMLAAAGKTARLVFGKPLAKVFEPFVLALHKAFGAVTEFFLGLPESTRIAIMGTIVAAAVLAVALGGLLFVGGLITVLLPFLATFILVIKALAIGLVLVTGVIALFAAGIALAVWAIRNNIGGLGDMFWKAVEKIKLFWRGLTDLISKGGFSEAVSLEMSKAENNGVRKFAVGFFMVFYRVKRFFAGVMQGFKQTFEMFEPVFGALGEAFRGFGEALASVGIDLLGVAGTPSDSFNTAGAGIGATIASIVAGIAWLLTGFIQAATWIIKLGVIIWKVFKFSFGAIMFFIEPVLNAIRELVSLEAKIGGKFAKWLGLGSPEIPRATGRGLGAPTVEEKPIIATSATMQGGMETMKFGLGGGLSELFGGGAIPMPPRGPSVAAGMPSPVPVGTPTTEFAGGLETLKWDVGSDMRRGLEELARAIERRPVVTTVNIDGTKVGEAVASAKRSRQSRGGMPVSGEDGL